MGEHSIYSPSGMAGKLLCPGKHLATMGMDSGSSPAAERGTEVHDHLEKKVANPSLPSPTWKEDWQEECMQNCFDHTMETYDDLSIMGNVEVKLEEKVNLGWLASAEVPFMEEVYGTADVIMYCEASKTLVVLDYKTGKGIDVSPIDNVQGMIYALGALAVYPDAERVVIAISQPRLHSELQTWNTNVPHLEIWAKETLLPALAEMVKEDAKLCPGEKQCRWCAVSGVCRAQKDEYINMLDDAPVEKVTSGNLSSDELNELLLRVKEFKLWINAVEGQAQGLMESGTELAGFKLVHGRGSRGWIDEEAANKFLKGQKLKDAERYPRKLLTFPAAEKLLAKKLKSTTITRNNFYKLVKKTEGKVTWAPKSDKREAISVADPLDALITMEDLL